MRAIAIQGDIMERVTRSRLTEHEEFLLRAVFWWVIYSSQAYGEREFQRAKERWQRKITHTKAAFTSNDEPSLAHAAFLLLICTAVILGAGLAGKYSAAYLGIDF